ncbi:MAG: delta-60 repeat domain-containing protein [Actinomycetota bacterium]
MLAKKLGSILGIASILTAGIIVPVASAQPVGHPILVSENPIDITPHVLDGQVRAIAQVGDQVIVGGTFTEVRNQGTQTVLTRRNLFAFSAATGQIDTDFNPRPDDVVESLQPAPDGAHVLVGGSFSAIGGQSRRKVARIRASDGAVDPAFEADFDAKVLDLLVVGQRLFVAGAFHGVEGVDREGLAAVDVATGAIDPGVNVPFTQPFLGQGTQAVRKIDANPAGRRLVAVGNFTRVNGRIRSQVAVLNIAKAPARVVRWRARGFEEECSPAFDSYMRDVDVDPQGRYFVVVTTGAWRPTLLCDSASRWELGAKSLNVQPTWIDWTGGDTIYSVSTTGTAVYVGGHFRWWNNPYASNAAGAGAVPREGIAALDPLNGLPLNWDPTRDRGVGVFSFVPTSQGMWVGSDTDGLGGEFHSRVGFFPLAGGRSVPPSVVGTLPGQLYELRRSDGNMVRRSFDGSDLGSPSTVAPGVNWATARGSFEVSGVLYTGRDDGRLIARTFDGTSTGPAQTVELYDLDSRDPASAFRIPGTNLPVPRFDRHLMNATGMFFDQGRLYYTVAGEPRLYYRYFTPSSRIVGAVLHVADTSGANGIDYGSLQGMTMADGQLFVVDAADRLASAPFTNGVPDGPATPISGPGIDGIDWTSRGLFVS